MPCGLYYNIKETIWVAMLYDYNMMIEEYNFYSQLPYRYQKELVETLFEEFIEMFEPFFSL